MINSCDKSHEDAGVTSGGLKGFVFRGAYIRPNDLYKPNNKNA